MRLAILALLAFSVAACPKPYPPPVPPGPDVDASTPDTRPATCADVCAHAAALGCRWSRPTPNGATCETVCLNIMSSVISWDLPCRIQAESCAAVEECERQ